VITYRRYFAHAKVLYSSELRLGDPDAPRDDQWFRVPFGRPCGSSVTGMGNIRDVIPFPRTPKSAEF